MLIQEKVKNRQQIRKKLNNLPEIKKNVLVLAECIREEKKERCTRYIFQEQNREKTIPQKGPNLFDQKTKISKVVYYWMSFK